MSTTINQTSILWRLRQLMPRRPLLTHEGLRLAELQANRLLEWSGVSEPGTPSEIVSSLPFVEVAVRHDLPVSGLTNWYKPRWLILLSGLEPGVRRRFSLMHEFKHILDHDGIDYRYPATWSTSSDRRAEFAADYFAACLLMPKRLIARRYGEGQHEVSELAAEFGVSEVAMRYRLQQLGLIDNRRCAGPSRPLTPGEYARQGSPALLVAN